MAVGDETTLGFIKGTAINLLSLYTFLMPILCCLVQAETLPPVTKELCIAWAVAVVITIALPPFGWQKPYPTSEKEFTRG
eukprot:CAMPEP_0118994650 /NCGR_PEP_ID=MMETSP1173-20130426/57155_1 /TAXON_ID=1034831 /ORGANISM="Rhizochromulina marina cf, Strain CCMP1243" /LENGTH=79 /DNA_ID=CAMNT_0006945955 /DNA_START=11 /DNA_END=250 /DNA_ORIENTATION=+